MSIRLLTTCEPEAIRGAATTVQGFVDDLAEEFTPLNLRALALTESDWEGEAAAEFRTTWIEFRTACGIMVEVMRDTAKIMTKLADRLELAKSQFESAVAEARAAGLQVDMTTGEVTPPPVVLNPDPILPLGSREFETADAVRRANLEIQDAIQEAVRADEEAEAALAALQPKIDALELALKNLGVGIDGYGGMAGNIAGMAKGAAVRGPTVAADRWGRIANHPAVRIANTPLARGVPVLKSIPALAVVGTGVTYAQNLEAGDNPARSATRAVASNAANFAVGAGITAGVTIAASVLAPAAMAGAGAAIVLGGALAIGMLVSPHVQRWGDGVGREFHDEILTPANNDIKRIWNDLF